MVSALIKWFDDDTSTGFLFSFFGGGSRVEECRVDGKQSMWNGSMADRTVQLVQSLIVSLAKT